MEVPPWFGRAVDDRREPRGRLAKVAGDDGARQAGTDY